jgi:protein-tyrosine phosphatase
MSSSFRRAAHDLLCVLGVRTDTGSWILPGQVLACARPITGRAWATFAAAEIRVIVNLQSRPHQQDRLAKQGLIEVHLPTRDFSPPSLALLHHGVTAIEEALARGQRVAVHCRGGRGRSGTLLACLLVARGASPAEALVRVRHARPGAVETRGQEAAVRAFATMLEEG